MKKITLATNYRMDRRAVLRGAGVAMSLPWLDSMTPVFGRDKKLSGTGPLRFVGMSNGLGFHAPYFFPEQSGRDYIASRFPSLVLASQGTTGTSYMANGSMIPPESSPQRLFEQLFVEEDSAARAAQKRRLREGQSIMDVVADDAKAMRRRLGPSDRDKLDAYFTSVRDLESRLKVNEAWVDKPKPRVAAAPPDPVQDNNDTIAMQAAMYDVMFLALQTVSTRFMTLHTEASGQRIPPDGVDQGYHQLSHHGLNEQKITQLAIIEEAQMKAWGHFLKRLHDTREGGASLLDNTMLLLTSNLGNASSHDTKNMPVILAGGGFNHGQHLAFDPTNNYPLPNLYTTMLHRLGLEIDAFASATGTMRDIEAVLEVH